VPALNVDVPDDLHRRIKIRAAAAGMTLKSWVLSALDRVATDEEDAEIAADRRRRR
jgi:predicted HicB family RNase H-like nuclease